MSKSRRAVRAITLSIVVLGLSIQSLSASELSDSESRADQLRQSLESDTQLLNVTLRGYELDAFNCIQQYRGETSPEAVALRNDCQTALDRTQADIFTVTRRAAATKNELTSLRALIEKLKSTPTPAPSPSVSQSTDPAPPSTSIGSEPNNSVPNNPVAPTSVIEKDEPAPSVPSKAPVVPSPEPRISNSPTAKPRATQSAKSKPKPITITCVQGKISKKVTDVTPKCPVGYKKK